MKDPRAPMWYCRECEEVVADADLLRAANPFDSEDIVFGCPACKSVSSFVGACDELGCKRQSSSGTPTPDGGYRSTCYDHRPAQEKTE